jgi:hypothetical protein
MGHLIYPTEEELAEKRPKHLDYKVMLQLVNEQDEVEDLGEEFVNLTGVALDEAMMESLRASVSLCGSSPDAVLGVRLMMGMGEVEEFLNFFRAAFLAGLCEGLERHRGIEIPESWDGTAPTFWDLDGASTVYVTEQRVPRGMYDVESDETRDQSPLVIMGSLWLDGFTIGIRFDDAKEKYINA